MSTTPEDASAQATQTDLTPPPAAQIIIPEPSTPARWPRWLGNTVLGGAAGVLLIGFLALTLARFDVIGKLTGFITFMSMLIPAAIIAVLAVIALLLARRGKGSVLKAGTALVLSLGLVVGMYFGVIRPGQSAPALHDITTNVDNPPQFTTLTVRADNLIPFDTIEQWRAAHRQGYPDLQPILINQNPSEVLARARALAEAKGWTVASTDPQGLQMEATAYAGYPRFHDDVIVKVTPVVDGSSRVDMRSVSQVGLSDLGYNAARIREFLGELQAG